MSQGEIWPKQEEVEEGQQQINVQPQTQKRKNKKRTILNPTQSTGHWSEQEHKTYMDFLNIHRSVMESSDQKKTSKIFKLMSETIGTRSPSQCRSHHQKFNPFVHQVKKRQKGAGRKKKGEMIEKTNNGFIENAFFPQMLFPPQGSFLPQQPYDYPMMQMPQLDCRIPLMFPFVDGLQKDDEIKDPQMCLQYIMPPPQMSQMSLEDKNLYYNFNFMQPHQVSLNFNYYQTYPNELFGTNSAEIINKDNQSDEQ